MAEDPSKTEVMEDEVGETDESVPRSPTEPNPASTRSGTAATEDLPAAGAATEDLDEVDPFTYKPPFTLCDKITIAINALWLFPLRLIFIVLPALIVGTFVCASSTFCERYDPDNPTPRAKWRRVYADTVAPIVDRVFLFGFGFHWIHYKGRPAKTEEAPIIILAPHSSFLDVFAVSLYSVPTFVAREDMRRTCIFGPIMARSLRTIFVQRDDPNSRMKAAEEIQRRATSGGVWPKVLLFPEGTTHNHKMLLTFKRGAFLPKLPVQPFLIKYNNRLVTTTWGRSGKNMLFSLFFTMCQFHNSLELEFKEVYVPSEEEKADTNLFARNVQAMVSKSLGIPTGVQSIEDNYFMSYAKKLGLPFTSGMILYNRISKQAGIKFAEIRTFLTRFASIDVNKDGWITPQDMATFLSVPNDACLQALFWTIADKASEEKLSFKQYMYGFVARAKPFLADNTFLTSVFNFFDRDKDGSVSMSDISHVLPVTKLPHMETPKMLRRRRGRGRDSERRREEASPSQSQKGLSEHQEEEEEEEEGMDFDQFKCMLETNPEYLLLFHECQNAGLSSPSSNNHSQDTKVVIEVKEEP